MYVCDGLAQGRVALSGTATTGRGAMAAVAQAVSKGLGAHGKLRTPVVSRTLVR